MRLAISFHRRYSPGEQNPEPFRTEPGMAALRVEPHFDRGGKDHSYVAHGLRPDLSRVLVVGNSQINRIVVARIVERAGLEPVCEPPASATRLIPLIFPALVILDGGPDHRDCESVAAGIAALRRISGGRLPAAILLANRNPAPLSPLLCRITDVVVTKPFTTRQLQPEVEMLARESRS